MNDMHLTEYFEARNEIKFHHLDAPIYSALFTKMIRLA
jgi:hypothetical protein